MNTKHYKIFNLIIAGIAFGIIVYSGFFYFLGETQVSCVHQKYFGKACPSCGFSRAFSEFVFFRFKKGIALNNYALPVYLYIVFQFISRLIISGINEIRSAKPVFRKTDFALNIILFLYVFVPLLLATYRYYLNY
jgi:hypothetical protein